MSEAASEKDLSEAAALSALDILAPLQVLNLLRGQTCRRILNSMGWVAGRYELSPQPRNSPEARPLGCALPPIIQQGIATHWGVDRLLAELATELAGYARPQSNLARLVGHFNLSTREATLLRDLEGSRRASDILDQELNSPDLLAALWVLHQLDAVTFSPSPVEDPQEGDPGFDAEIDILSLIHI